MSICRRAKTGNFELIMIDSGKPDIYYLHAADRSVPFAETLAEVDKMHKEGKFVRLGLSKF